MQSVGTATGVDDAGYPVEHAVFVYSPGATITVLAADMSDAAYSADGLAYPQWAILLNPGQGTRIDIIDDMEPIEITEEMLCIVHIESKMSVLDFVAYD